jgi:hypothetical protein
MNIATATPSEIDTRIAQIQMAVATTQHRVDYLLCLVEGGYATAAHVAEKAERQAQLNEYYAELDLLRAEYAKGQWERYYLVTNTNGHVHTSMHCDTCFATTEFGWLTQFSGIAIDEVGALAGETACARCFPNLPAEVMARKADARMDTPERIAAREKNAAEKAAKAAKAAAKAIANPDGSPLMMLDHFGSLEEVKTEVAASRRVMEAAFNLRWYGAGAGAEGWKQNVEHGLVALAHKRGTTVEAERAALDKKVEAKYRREMR